MLPALWVFLLGPKGNQKDNRRGMPRDIITRPTFAADTYCERPRCVVDIMTRARPIFWLVAGHRRTDTQGSLPA